MTKITLKKFLKFLFNNKISKFFWNSKIYFKDDLNFQLIKIQNDSLLRQLYLSDFKNIMLFKFIFEKKKKKLQEQSEKKIDMNNWMNLTREERLQIDFKEKNELMKKKKALLKSIRAEYIKITKKK